MKRVRILVLAAIALLSASSAWAQFGLYGAPQLLRLPPVAQVPSQQVTQYGQVAVQPAPTSARPVGGQYMRRPLTTQTAYVPGEQCYEQPFQQPMMARPIGPVSESPAPGNTFVAGAPAQSGNVRPMYPVDQPIPAPQLPPPEQSSGNQVISRMLRESGSFGPNPWSESAASGASCPSAGMPVALGGMPSPWFVGAEGLVMGRDAPNRVWTTYSSADQSIQLMHTNDIELGWEPGAQITFGRHLSGGRWSLGATYWSLNAFSGFASESGAGRVATPFDFTDVAFADPILYASGVEPRTMFDYSQEHRLWRTDEVHNIELNLTRRHCDFDMVGFGTCNPLSVDWILGARFLRFDEDLKFGSLQAGPYTWETDLYRQGYLENRCTNNLAGFQFGCNLDYTVYRSWRLFVRPKIGIYNNHIQNSFRGYRGDGKVFAPDPNPPPPPVRSAVPGSYPVNAETDRLSFMTEVDLGVEWRFLPNWSFTAGYRVLAATGIGLSDNQFPPYIVDIPELANIDSNGQLVLHGVFSGIEFNY